VIEYSESYVNVSRKWLRKNKCTG